MMKLPKQWKHWCQKEQLKVHCSPRWKSSWFNVKGQGRYWRVNATGMFQWSKPYDSFDRWANSLTGESVCPTSYVEFSQIIRQCQTI